MEKEQVHLGSSGWVEEGEEFDLHCLKRTKNGKACNRSIRMRLVAASVGYAEPVSKWSRKHLPPTLDMRNMEWRCYQHKDIAEFGEHPYWDDE